MKRFETFIATILLGATVLISACVQQTGWKTPGELFPLQVGSYWKYRVTGKTGTTTVENSIATSLVIGGTEWFESVEYGETFWIRNSKQGQVEAINLYTKKENAAVFEKLDPKSLHEELLFKFPATEGESWSALENIIRYEGIRYMTVPAGSFNCHLYSLTQYDQTYSHSCFAEGVGIIYSDNILENGQREVSELIEWGKK